MPIPKRYISHILFGILLLSIPLYVGFTTLSGTTTPENNNPYFSTLNTNLVTDIATLDDTTAPTIELLNDTPIEFFFDDPDAKVVFKIIDDNPDKYWVYLGPEETNRTPIAHGTYESSEYISISLYGLFHGVDSSVLWIHANDTYGNENHISAELNVRSPDTTAPVISVANGTSIEYHLGESARIVFSIREEHPDRYGVLLNKLGCSSLPCNWTLAQGSYSSGETISVSLSDVISETGSYIIHIFATDTYNHGTHVDISLRVLEAGSGIASTSSGSETSSEGIHRVFGLDTGQAITIGTIATAVVIATIAAVFIHRRH